MQEQFQLVKQRNRLNKNLSQVIIPRNIIQIFVVIIFVAEYLL